MRYPDPCGIQCLPAIFAAEGQVPVCADRGTDLIAHLDVVLWFTSTVLGPNSILLQEHSLWLEINVGPAPLLSSCGNLGK